MTSEQPQEFLPGLVCAVSAFLIWGFSPIYVKSLKPVPVTEIVMHRIVWSFLFLLLLLLLQRRWDELAEALKTPRTLLTLLASTVMLGANWSMANWAVICDHVLQISLGYFISPLLSVFLGVIFLRERLSPAQTAAVALAAAAVVYLCLRSSGLLWLTFAVAFSAVSYTLIRKLSPVRPLVGLCVETLFLSVPVLVCFMYMNLTGTGHFLRISIMTDLLLAGTPLITALPLLLLVLSTKRLSFSFIGILQYVMPTCHFLLAVFLFHEPLMREQMYTFVMIWIALAVYSADSVISYKRAAR
ncbi:EamA family transporter RarD [Desulfobacterales bacterium HSG2]|nr:EamA family transporter RarD [Desulfobacterales bacterium HSG2]